MCPYVILERRKYPNWRGKKSPSSVEAYEIIAGGRRWRKSALDCFMLFFWEGFFFILVIGWISLWDMKPSWHLFSRITLILFWSTPSAKRTIFTRNWICQYCFLWCQRSNKISFRRSGRTQESNVVDAVWRPSWKYGCKLKDSSAFLVLVYLEWTYIGRYPQWCLFFRDHSSGRGGGRINCFTTHLKTVRTGRGK